MAAKRAAVYCRISDDRVGAGLGVARQQADCEALITARGWAVADVYVDNDVSAYSGKRRPEYERMMADLEDGLLDVVTAWHPDRLHRSPRELEDFIDALEHAKASVVTVQAGTYDLSTPAGRLAARIVGATARAESEHKSERALRKALELAEDGKISGGGTRPFGYNADMVTVNEAEAELIREAVDRVLAGDSMRGICRDWDARGIRNTTGNRWQQAPLRRLLLSWRIAGIRSHKGQRVAEAVWPAIIDEFTAQRLHRLLLDPTRTTTNVPARRYPLRGVLYCSDCDKVMLSRPRADGVRRYICAAGPPSYGCSRAVVAEPLEVYLAQAVAGRIDAETFNKTLHATDEVQAEREGLLRDLEEVRVRTTEAARAHFADKGLSASDWAVVRRDLQARSDALQAALERLDAVPVLRDLPDTAHAFLAAWEGYDEAQRRRVFRAFFDRIDVKAGRRGYNKFEPGRLVMHWRD